MFIFSAGRKILPLRARTVRARRGGVLVSQFCGRTEEPRFTESANFCGVNTPPIG